MLLLPLLRRTEQPRVATRSGGTAFYGRIHFDLQHERRYSPNRSYTQSKLADLMLTLRLADISTERWNLLSTGDTPTNLQTSGANLGREARSGRCSTAWTSCRHRKCSRAPSRSCTPLSIRARNGEYFCPSGRFGLVGPSGRASIPRQARNTETASRLWAEEERPTGTHLID